MWLLSRREWETIEVYVQKKAMVSSGILKGHSSQRVGHGLEGTKTGEETGYEAAATIRGRARDWSWGSGQMDGVKGWTRDGMLCW